MCYLIGFNVYSVHELFEFRLVPEAHMLVAVDEAEVPVDSTSNPSFFVGNGDDDSISTYTLSLLENL